MTFNLSRLLLSALLTETGRDALQDETTTLSRGQLIAAVRARADALQVAGIEPDTFVIVLCGRGCAFWVDLLALWAIGAKAVCVEPDLGPDHGANILLLTEARHLSASGIEIPATFAALTALPAPDLKVDVGDARAQFSSLAFNTSQSGMAGIIFTSGTTGLPKAVPLTHRALTINALATARRLALSRDDRLMIATPYRFISSISHFIVTLLSGGAFFGVERTLMIKDLLTLLNERDITAFGGSPFHMQFIAAAGQARLPGLRWAMSSGDHLRTEVIEQIARNFDDLRLNVVYGMAELGGRFCIMPAELQAIYPASVGFPIDGLELDILDDEMIPCPPGEIGHIFARGHLAFEGYFRNDAANSEAITPHGFRTGDKGYLNEDGFMWLSGRSDAVFKRLGLKVSAQVISDALLAIEGVEDAFVRAEPDPVEGRVPVAFVTGPLSNDHKALTDALRPILPIDHLPKRFVAMTAIPRTGSGKVDRRALKALVGL